MLSDKKIKQLLDTFITLSQPERQVIALKAICFEYNDERTLVSRIIESNLTDHTGQVFTQNAYRVLCALLDKLGFLKSKKDCVILPELRHAILTMMSEKDMIWVHGVVERLYLHVHAYSERTRDIKARALLSNAVYANQPDLFDSHEDDLGYCNKLILDLYHLFSAHSLDIDWLQSRHPIIRAFICVAQLSHFYCDIKPAIDYKTSLTVFSLNKQNKIHHDYLNYCSGLIYLAWGDLDSVIDYSSRIQDEKSGFIWALQATVAFLNKQFGTASKLYRKALAALRKHSEVRQFYFDTILGVFHGFCVAYVDKNLNQLITNATHYAKCSEITWVMPMRNSYWFFPIIGLVEEGDQKTAQEHLASLAKFADTLSHPLLIAVYQILCYMTHKDHIMQNQDTINTHLQHSIEGHQTLASHVFNELLAKTDAYQTNALVYLEASPIQLRVLDFFQVKDLWEYSFQALEGLLLDDGHSLGRPTKTKRLMWLVDPDRHLIDVVEQTLGKSGVWSRGRAISLSKLKYHHVEGNFDYLSAQDLRVVQTIDEVGDGWRGYHYAFSPYQGFLALIGHPHIAHYQNRDVAIELVAGEPELHIEENKQGYRLSLSHYLPDEGLIIEPLSQNKYRVVDFSRSLASIGQVITEKGLTIPASAKEKVLNVIQHAKRDIKIHVGISDIGIPELSGDANPCIQLLPIKEGVRATLWVKPLADHGAYFKLAEGNASFIALLTDNGRETRTRVLRNLAAEKKNQNDLLAHCLHLSHHEYDKGEYEIETPEDVLEVLSELQQYASEKPLTIEWPQGQSFKIKQRIGGKNLSLNIATDHNWFEYKGQVTLDDGEVIGMQELLESFNSQAFGRFVRLGNGEFIELTSQLKKQLSVLHALSDDNKINTLGAQVLSDIVSDVEHVTFDAGWTSHVKKIKTMQKHAPKVPTTLQASLRDYQIEGFQYLSRLSHWGIGACLADDMGLGKTVQTIALLLERAKKGPALVVAPTSVCFNWMQELIKFAPTLKGLDLRSDQRESLISQAGSFDVVVCSYGLLQHNADLLEKKRWETIVLDEAQAIKNAQTQRWKTVMRLKGNSRIALSGTPIENHLGELWSIFSFINPGLLGSVKSFQNKYAIPIETKQIPDRINALRALVQPYILRRIKSDVLCELPPKTEQTIYVEPTEQETVFYEALRRTAEERMVQFMAENNRISALAEITKLRQACCDSSLVDGAIRIENSKLNTFIETLKSIIDNGHKALVFSQYVSFLSIVKARIEAESIPYQYLDGSTSAVNRKKSVDAFQSGEGDVFFLSLKAGGSGLNLTAADYVIHLDPWWNPAVEDQASDRAHRIGQERPVTIYRFIMKNTIEEKIISLHEHKRNLSNELLSGQGTMGKLSNDDLMNLISSSAMPVV